ncbi:hypothetical protein XNC1_2020 [Xenorhabdus nematophila ATCC 19061]|uniref:Uncharacterized protein n=1 Tax=Xenorhabdus nematophila (strain ATCC 19061 / DSM 3370 / CCUG 14189 / LMG 1036 / NCIMB 9965 / AN6) TaxID=406817 RepID=D3VE13_XENNA|nr:hypothetical protein XNC1_2020 [Xenorhabdus nematophila ATCC 19061]
MFRISTPEPPKFTFGSCSLHSFFCSQAYLIAFKPREGRQYAEKHFLHQVGQIQALHHHSYPVTTKI